MVIFLLYLNLAIKMIQVTIAESRLLFLIKLKGSLIHNHIQFLIRLYLVQQLISILVYYFLLLVHLLQPKSNFMINQLKLCIHWSVKLSLLNPNINTSIHIFDHTIKPILLYGCEIWACSLPKKTFIDDLFDFNKIARSFYSEKLHVHFCKYTEGK